MNTCRREWTDHFLSGTLSDADEAAFEEHLDHCLDCRNLLEAQAGDESSWRAARELLRYVASPESASERNHNADIEQIAEANSAMLSFLARPTIRQ